MDLSRPISTVVPSLDGPVLAVLARTTEPLTGRRVQQLAGVGSEPGVRKVLQRLTSTGLVGASQAGASILYTLNRQHLAAAAVEQLTTMRQRLVDRIRAAIDDWAIVPVHASLFGSVARGDGGLDSDIDILLIHRDFPGSPPAEWADLVGDLADQVFRWTGNHAQLYELSLSQLDEHLAAEEPIVQEWYRDAVTVAGVEFRHLRSARRTAR
ncbi:nucleotidyltransferase-like protein [Kribbella steppae]|uniref:Nucleotidyltransferase-like protein n=1 Tax=Kribbella steppae TaxID=2512223 RepID=A0A4R2HB48_9ACTN|nr:nucleotidyltransferase domain-containing protein [Kribbella steppae]TCO24574.1 nucleotidyltransferase-like protein [Kribbella steppae]